MVQHLLAVVSFFAFCIAFFEPAFVDRESFREDCLTRDRGGMSGVEVESSSGQRECEDVVVIQVNYEATADISKVCLVSRRHVI